MERSELVNEIAKALSLVQGAIKGAKKDADNPYFKSKYADLASVWEACRAELAKHEIAVVQAPANREGLVSVTTMLIHSSGQWISETLDVKPKDDGAQALGSVITYLRRYALAAFVGVAPEDDDGEAAEGREKGQKAKADPRKARTGDDAVITSEQQSRLVSIATKAGRIPADIQTWLKATYGVSSSSSILRKDYDAVCAALEARGPLSMPGDGE